MYRRRSCSLPGFYMISPRKRTADRRTGQTGGSKKKREIGVSEKCAAAPTAHAGQKERGANERRPQGRETPGKTCTRRTNKKKLLPKRRYHRIVARTFVPSVRQWSLKPLAVTKTRPKDDVRCNSGRSEKTKTKKNGFEQNAFRE